MVLGAGEPAVAVAEVLARVRAARRAEAVAAPIAKDVAVRAVQVVGEVPPGNLGPNLVVRVAEVKLKTDEERMLEADAPHPKVDHVELRKTKIDNKPAVADADLRRDQKLAVRTWMAVK
jgi:hypothetical protein